MRTFPVHPGIREKRFWKAESQEHHRRVKNRLRQQAWNARSESHLKARATPRLLLEDARLERRRGGRLLEGQAPTQGSSMSETPGALELQQREKQITSAIGEML